MVKTSHTTMLRHLLFLLALVALASASTPAPTHLPTHLPTAIPSQSPTAPTPFNCTQAVLWQTATALALALVQWVFAFIYWGCSDDDSWLIYYPGGTFVLSLLWFFMILWFALSPQNMTTNCMGYVVSFAPSNLQTQLGLAAVIISAIFNTLLGVYTFFGYEPPVKSGLNMGWAIKRAAAPVVVTLSAPRKKAERA